MADRAGDPDPPPTGALTPGPLLAGRTAIVTGGGGGIGGAVSRAFAAHGAVVVLAELDAGRANATEKAIVGAGGRARAVVVDVRDRAAPEALLAAAHELGGGVDVLVNNVGHFVTAGEGFLGTDDDDWDAIIAANLTHVLRMTRAALPSMIGRGGGSIVNLTTVEAHRGIPHHPVYAAAKAAVAQFSRSLAVDVGRHGVRVNAVAPDVTRSLQLPYDRWLTDDDRARIPTWVPLGRLGEPDDVAGVVLFLASDLGGFVTGTTVHVDGGTYAAGGWYPTEHGSRRWTNRPHDP
jgi:2-hydroxycyclohexanecarboxyl-CoA dehydrogenase